MQLLNLSLAKINKAVRWLCYFVFFASTLPMAVFAFRQPLYNWDVLAYMALAARIDDKNMDEVHEVTYSSARQNIPAADYEKLTTSEVSRKKRAESPSEFNSVLPFYMVKPFYIWLTYAFYKGGFTLPVSTVLPSIISYLLIGMMLFHWLNRDHKLFFSFAVSWLIMFSPVMVNGARLSTPDCLSSLILFGAFYFILEKPSVLPVFLFFAAAIFARLDNIVLCFIVISFLHFSRRWSIKTSLFQYILMIAFLAGIYFLVTSQIKEDGWNALYYSTFIKYYDTNYQFHASISFSRYIALFWQRAIMAVVNTHFSFYLLLVLLMLSKYFPVKPARMSTELLFCLMLVSVVILRFILFPDFEDRFYIAYYLVTLVLFMKQYKTRNSLAKKEPAVITI